MKNTFLLFIIMFTWSNYTSAQWQQTGNANATTSSILGTTNAVPLNLTTNNTKRLVIDTLGRVGVGTASPVNIFTVKSSGSNPVASWVNAGAPLFVGFGETTVGSSDFILSMASNAFNARPVLIGRRSRGTLAAPTLVANNDYLSSLLVSGYDGTSFQNPAAVDFFVDGTPSSGNVPARISFVTGTNSSNRTERLKVGSTGNISFNNTQLTLAQSTGNIGIGQGNLNFSANTQTIQFPSNDNYLSKPMINMFATGNTNKPRMIIAHSPNYPTLGLQYNDSLDQFDFVAFGVSGMSIDPFLGNVRVTNKLTARNLVSSDTSTFGGRVGVNGPTQTGYALNVNSSSSLSGIGITDPINNYALACEKSGESEGIYILKSSNTTSTPCIAGYSIGAGGGVEGDSHTGIGVRGVSDSSYGIFGNTGNSLSYAGYFNGNVFSTGNFQTSDARLKRNIKPLENGMEIINQLQPKIYEFRKDGKYALLNLPDGNHYGLLAQDLEQTISGLVKDASINSKYLKLGQRKEGETGDEISFKGVNYSELIPIMIKGMQEHETKMLNQEERIQQLESLLKNQNIQIELLKELIEKLAPGSKATLSPILSKSGGINKSHALEN